MEAFEHALRHAFQDDGLGCLTQSTLQRHVLKQLSPQESEQVALHLACCGHCLQAYRRSNVFHLDALKHGVARLSDEAKAIRAGLAAWLHALTEAYGVEMVGTRSTVGITPFIRAQVVDATGEPTGQTLSLQLVEPPRLSGGRLRFSTTFPNGQYVDSQGRLFLRKDDVKLDLGRVAPVEGRLEANIDLGAFGLQDGPLPAAFIRVEFPAQNA